MGSLKNLFGNFGAQFQKFWQQLTGVRKLIVIGVGVLAVGGIVTLVAFSKKDAYEYLFVDVGSQDLQEISAYLKKSGYNDFLIDSQGIKVKPEDTIKLRILLSQEGLPAQGVVGWEKFDTQDFTRTEFEQQVHKLRAIQGELARTISAIDGIASARVHIVQSKQSLFVEDQKEPTAAIYIRTKRGHDLDRKQIRGIMHLVSRSVEGLKPENVTIIDFEGKMLTQIESQDYATKMTKERLSYKTEIEKELEERIRAIVGRIVGPDRVAAKVDANVDFTQEEQTVTDVDPDRGAPVSKETRGGSINGTGLGPTGIPGAKSNIPGEKEATAQGGGTPGTNSKNESELVNFEYKRSVSKKLMPIGNVMSLSAAVLVDGKQAYAVDGSKPEFMARTAEEMKKIEDLVKLAIGYKDGRDSVVVHNMMFELDPFQVQDISQKKKENREYISTLAISGTIALALVLFFAFIVRPYFRWLSYDPERKRDETIVEDFKPEIEAGGIKNVQIKEDVPFEKLSEKEQVLYLARHDPKRTTEAIRILLNPHQSVTP